MGRAERTSGMALLAAAAVGAAAGWLLQFGLVSRGASTLVPPISLPVTLAAVAAVLVVFAVRLRRTVTKRPGDVNPFHAVRLLVTARAGQYVGAVFGGFGAGLWIALAGRSVPPAVPMWLPMLLTIVAGLVLVACGVVAEWLCRVPPGSGDDAEAGDDDPAPGPADQPAYRHDH